MADMGGGEMIFTHSFPVPRRLSGRRSVTLSIKARDTSRRRPMMRGEAYQA